MFRHLIQRFKGVQGYIKGCARLLFMDQIGCRPCPLLGTPVASLPVWKCDQAEATWPYTQPHWLICMCMYMIGCLLYFSLFTFFFLLHIHLISNVLCNSFYDEGHKAKHVGVTIKLLCTGVAGVHSIIFGHFYPLHVLCNLTIYLN